AGAGALRRRLQLLRLGSGGERATHLHRASDDVDGNAVDDDCGGTGAGPGGSPHDHVPGAGGIPSPRRGARPRWFRLVHRPGHRRTGSSRPGHRRHHVRQARQRVGATRGHRRPGRGGVGHRRRAQRHRPGRRLDAGGQAVPASGRHPHHQHEHRRLRARRCPVVHRPVGLLRPPGSPVRPGRCARRTPRRRPVRHHGDPRRRRVLRVTGRQPRRPDRHLHRAGHPDRPAHRPPGRPAGVVGLGRTDLGQRVERRPGRRAGSGHRAVAGMEAAGQPAAGVRGLRRRQGPGVAQRLRGQRPRDVRSQDGDVPELPARFAERERPPDTRPSRGGLGSRIRRRPAGRGPGRL
ncbi:MAG: Putative hydrolase, partial [uncultured Acidimicrobiales bacterium]